MKLAEALQERADLNKKIEQLSYRIENNTLVQEGESPSENPEKLIVELNESLERLEFLMSSINLTNSTHKVDGLTLTEMIAKKDMLSLKQSKYRDIIYSALQTTKRARNTEIKILQTVSVEKLQKKSDEIAKELRLLDNKIQQTNWQVDLIEK